MTLLYYTGVLNLCNKGAVCMYVYTYVCLYICVCARVFVYMYAYMYYVMPYGTTSVAKTHQPILET